MFRQVLKSLVMAEASTQAASSVTAALPTMLKRVPIPRRGVDYRGKVVLAPMVRSGELPSRLLALHYGADLVWGPETVDRSMIGTTRKVNPLTNTIEFVRAPSHGHSKPTSTSITATTTSDGTTSNPSPESIIFTLHPTLESSRLIFQIGTSDPDRAVACAHIVAPDVAGIDVNAGCPKPFSTHAGMGAALLQTPDKLVAILEALVREIMPKYEIGISVKIRLLETAEKTEALVRKLVATGITGLTIHCRTTPMRPRERAIREQLRMVGELCREAGVACLMNGDVADRDAAMQLAEEYAVDGGMIATAAEKNPSCFRTVAEGGMHKWDEAVAKYVEFALDVHNRWGNTKFLLSQMIPGKSPAYLKAVQSKSYSMLCAALDLEHLAKKAAEVDEQLGLDTRPLENGLGRKRHSGASGSRRAEKMAKRKHDSTEASKVIDMSLPPAMRQPEVATTL